MNLFLSREVALYLYKSTIQPCLKYCCHVCTGASSCHFGFLDKLQKWICRTFDPTAYHWNIASWRLLYRYYVGRWSFELARMVPVPYCWARSSRYSDSLHDFSVTVLDVTRMFMSTISFLTQLGSGILCLSNAFLWPTILVALGLGLTDIF